MSAARVHTDYCGLCAVSLLTLARASQLDFCFTKRYLDVVWDRTALDKPCFDSHHFRALAKFSFVYNFKRTNFSAPFPVAYHHIEPGKEMPRTPIPTGATYHSCHTELVY